MRQHDHQSMMSSESRWSKLMKCAPPPESQQRGSIKYVNIFFSFFFFRLPHPSRPPSLPCTQIFTEVTVEMLSEGHVQLKSPDINECSPSLHHKAAADDGAANYFAV